MRWRPLCSRSSALRLIFLVVFTGILHGCAGDTGSGTVSNPQPLEVTSASALPSAEVGEAYSTALAAAGGTAPYSWSVSAGALPGGLALSSVGMLSGAPTATGTFSFTAKTADENRTGTVNVTYNAPAGTSGSLVFAGAGFAQTYGIAATGTSIAASSVLTTTSSNAALTSIDAALQQVATTGAQLGAYLVTHKKLRPGEKLTIAQGVEMGRPSHIEVEIEEARGRLTPRVSGSAVCVLEGHIEA